MLLPPSGKAGLCVIRAPLTKNDTASCPCWHNHRPAALAADAAEHCRDPSFPLVQNVVRVLDLDLQRRGWQQKLRATLSNLGYHPLPHDNCIYVTKEGLSGIIIVTYVDDFLLLGRDPHKIKQLKETT